MGEVRLKKCIEYHFPVSIKEGFANMVAGAGIFEIPSRDAAVLPRPPLMSFAYSFFDQLETEVEYEGQKVLLRSDHLNRSGRFYLGGEVVDRDQFRSRFPWEDKAYQRMLTNGYQRMIKTTAGHFEPFGENDQIVN